MRRGVKLGVGIPAALVGALLTIAGLALLGFVGVDGTFTTPRTTATTDTHAIVVGTAFVDEDLRGARTIDGSVTVDVESRGGELFVGVADADDVAAYLDGVAFADAVELSYPGGDLGLRPRDGRTRPAPPEDQSFWIDSRVGDGRLTWDLDEGSWSLVLMNADGSAGVDVAGTATARIPALGTTLLVVLAIGAVLAGVGLWLIVSALRGRTPAAPPRPSGFTGPIAVPPRPDRP